MRSDNSTVAEDVSLERRLKELESLEALVAKFDDSQRRTVEALKCAIDALHKDAFSRLIRAFKNEPSALRALKAATADEIVYSVLRHHGLIKPSLDERIEQALDSVRPMLKGHGGNVELVEITSATSVVIRLVGACSGCASSELTLTEGVEKAIKEFCPEITEIAKAKGVCSQPSSVPADFISPFAKHENQAWKFAINLDQLQEDKIHVCQVGGQSLLLSRTDGKIVCYQNACSHLGMPLDAGEVKEGVLKCPYHSFEYSLATGECLTVPEVQLQTHAVRIVNNCVEICLS